MNSKSNLWQIIFIATVLWFVPAIGRADTPRSCSLEKIAQILSPGTSPGTPSTYNSEKQYIDCQLDLPSDAIVTRPLVLEGAAASNVTINCNGATLDGRHYPSGYKYRALEIRSKLIKDPMQGQSFGEWVPPVNVTIENCKILGSIRLIGMSEHAGGDAILWSSRAEGHIDRVRRAAPSYITFKNIQVEGNGGNAIYFSAGVNNSNIIDSRIIGNLRAAGLYMDAESYKNTIRNSYFKREIPIGADAYPAGERELISVDGSSHNLIVNNIFEGLAKGGIFLYRNCGENSVVRHSTPSYNEIINNVFIYYTANPASVFNYDKPAVFIGSRDGQDLSSNWNCSDDAGYLFGSSISDQDMASYNVAFQNHLTKFFPTTHTIRVGNSYNKENFISSNNGNFDNRAAAEVEQNEKAGCFVRNSASEKFLLNGKDLNRVLITSAADSASGSKVATLFSTKIVCIDSILRTRLTPTGLASSL
jgi:hypothetical protein